MMLDIRIRHRLPSYEMDLALNGPEGVVALFGRSGAGKTTVVNVIAGLLRPDAGRVVVGGEVLLDTEAGINVPRHKRRVGYVFQDGRLFPHLSVGENLVFGRRFSIRREVSPSLDRVLDLLGIEALLDRRPAKLSGGEKQRVAIGRALLSGARILLMDEPLASLDEVRKAEILPYLLRLKEETAMPILYVSHSLPEIAQLATTVAVMQRGRVMHVGPTQKVLSDPAFVPMIGSRSAGSVLRAVVKAHDVDNGLSTLAFSGGDLILPTVAVPPGSPVSIRIEARDVMVARVAPEGFGASNILAATVADIHEGEGPGAAVRLQLGSDLLLARMSRRSVAGLELSPGVRCFAIFKATAIAREDVALARPMKEKTA